ncbi:MULTISPECIES: hypothetical protein [Fictibacillus]|jgi:hypothetical protein|uniref:hypothetical protein n=1 Tax=Fictibacillus TaxID=1329200 RepID=UPI0012930D3B|nr:MULTISPECIES: hypothetical protein [Fictibacillus]MBH0169206.1 hypothetical protein [Fictibacillus sp. 18YEL24]
MTIERGDLVNYHDELHKVLHVYSSDFLEIRKVNEPYVPRVILVHKSEVTVQL